MFREYEQDDDPKFLERWAHAYVLVNSIPDDRRFYMYSWGAQDVESECDTAACAAGHCALHPWFIERGLRASFYGMAFDVYPADFFGLVGTSETPFDPSYYIDYGRPVYEAQYGLEEGRARSRIPPSVVADAILNWMDNYWGADATAAAIKDADTPEARYNMAEVHKRVPWSAEYDADLAADEAEGRL